MSTKKGGNSWSRCILDLLFKYSEETYHAGKITDAGNTGFKTTGYTKAEILTYYKEQGVKPPSRPIISKYYDMDVVPDDSGEKLSNEKAFDVPPFREAIIAILEDNNRGDFCISSVYDVLEEKFIENGDHESLPGNEQTLRNYVHYLERTGQLDTGEEHRRIYEPFSHRL